MNNLRQVGLAFHAFGHDHNGRFPMAVPASEGGMAELISGGGRNQILSTAQLFQPLSNELVTPKLLKCLADPRLVASRFSTLSNENVSYFVALSADPANALSLLSGDRNLTNDYAGASPVLTLGSQAFLRWTHELHRFKGDLLFSDGHVDEVNNLTLLTSGPGGPGDSTLLLPGVNGPAGGSGAASITGSRQRVDGGASTTAVSGNTPARSETASPVAGLAAGEVPGHHTRTSSVGGRFSTDQKHLTVPAPKAQVQPQPEDSSTRATAAAVVRPAGGFSPWPFWLLLAVVAITVVYVEARQRFEGKRKRRVRRYVEAED
jgi:hypothetical protein